MYKMYLLDSLLQSRAIKIYDDVWVTNPILTDPELELNGDNGILIGKLTFKLLSDASVEELKLLKSIVIVTETVRNVETVIFRGRPLIRDDDSYNDKDFTFEGILASLNDTIQVPSTETGLTFAGYFRTLITYHDLLSGVSISPSKLTNSDDCYLSQVRSKELIDEAYFEFIRSRASTMDHIKNQFIEPYGGYLYIEDEPFVVNENGIVRLKNNLRYVDIYDSEHRHINSQCVEFGKNLVSIKRSASAEDFATVYVPLGAPLTDVEKSWPYYRSTGEGGGWKIRKITNSPDDYELIDYSSNGAYINSETGKEAVTSNQYYKMPPDVNVSPGDVFFLTTYLEGVSTEVSAAAYAILSRDGQTLYSVGPSVRNSTDQNGNVEVKRLALTDERIEIPEDTLGTGLKLRLSRFASANDPNPAFILKKFNKNYMEQNVTIMSAEEHTDTSIRKYGRYDFGRDAYPDATDGLRLPEVYEQSKRIYNYDLYWEFGAIEKVIEYDNYASDNIENLSRRASSDLNSVGEKLEMEVQAVDLSYIDDSQEKFRVFDLVPVVSPPHNLNMLLPIVSMTLPLTDPASATYTLKNEVVIPNGSKKYVSQMVNSSNGKATETRYIYVSGGSGGGGGGSGDAENAVLYVMQDLQESQKAQARTNIGAVAAVAGKGLSSNDYTTAEKNKLAGIAAGAEPNVQPDWNQTDTSADDFIKNKPTIPAAQIQADWNQADTTAKDFIKNKPTIPPAQIQSDWNQADTSAKDFIKNKPTIPDAQIQSDWNQADTSAKDFIKNKPTIPPAQIQADWNQADTSAKDFIKNKPSIGDAVLYSQQLLTDEQKLQARANIYAGKSTVSYDQDYGTLSIETAGESAEVYFLSKFRRRTFYYNAYTGNTNLVYSEIASAVQQDYDVQCKITCGSSDFYAALRRDRSDSQAGPDMYVFDIHTYQNEDDALWWMSVRVYDDDTVEFYEGDYDPKSVKYHNVSLNADGSVGTAASSLVYSAIQYRLFAWQPSDYLSVIWGSTRFLAKAVEDINGIKFIADCEHDAMQRHMVFTLNTSNVLTTTAIETYSLRPITVWEVQDATQGLLARNTNISSNLEWHLTGLNLTPFKRIKIYSRAGRKTGALSADSSITPASIIEMSLDDRAKETVSQNVFIASSVVQNPNDPNRLGILTCAVSADKTKFAVVRATTLYGTAATSNTDAYPCVFKIEGYYD